jgi:hypothetical protein
MLRAMGMSCSKQQRTRGTRSVQDSVAVHRRARGAAHTQSEHTSVAEEPRHMPATRLTPLPSLCPAHTHTHLDLLLARPLLASTTLCCAATAAAAAASRRRRLLLLSGGGLLCERPGQVAAVDALQDVMRRVTCRVGAGALSLDRLRRPWLLLVTDQGRHEPQSPTTSCHVPAPRHNQRTHTRVHVCACVCVSPTWLCDDVISVPERAPRRPALLPKLLRAPLLNLTQRAVPLGRARPRQQRLPRRAYGRRVRVAPRVDKAAVGVLLELGQRGAVWWRGFGVACVCGAV